MNCLELFSGAGGLAKGLELSGFQHSTLVENNKHAYATLCNNFDPAKIFFGDIRNFDLNQLESIDIVAGGPPCQPFSLGGKHEGELDNRDMFPYAISAVQKLQPKAFIFENVKGLLRKKFSDYFEYIILGLTYPSLAARNELSWKQNLNELRKIAISFSSKPEYDVHFKLINAANYGIPQTRERIVIIGINSDLKSSFLFPTETHSEDSLFWDMQVTGEYWDRHKICELSRPVMDESRERKVWKIKENYASSKLNLMPWRTVRDVITNFPDPRSIHNMNDHIFRNGARIYPGHTGSVLDLPAKTIKAGDHGVPGGENMIRFPSNEVRYFTVFEAKQLQTFPEDFVIKGAWGEAMRQIGNAVPVLLAQKLGLEIANTLNIEKQSFGSKDYRLNGNSNCKVLSAV